MHNSGTQYALLLRIQVRIWCFTDTPSIHSTCQLKNKKCVRRILITDASHDRFFLRETRHGRDRHGRDRLGRLKTIYSLPRDENRKRVERASTRGHPVNMTILKIEIAREPARVSGAYRAIFVPNDTKKKHMSILPPKFCRLNYTYQCLN
jgi:hypothetical protein